MTNLQSKKSALLTWSDRGAEGPTPSYHGKRAPTDRGPVARMLLHWPECPAYECAWVLATKAGLDRAHALAGELEGRIAQVQCLALPVTDPTDHAQLFRSLGPVLERLERELPADQWQRDILLSAGTPQMQTLWVILVQAGLLSARMLQVIPDAFVPRPHPSPVREVLLDIDGFPEIRALRAEVRRLHAAPDWKGWALVGDSTAMHLLRDRALRVAEVDVPVLVLGETGSGKELLARAIHEASPRAGGPFVAENCAALAEGLLGSELFGHEAGAFTGAVGRRRGLFELAHGGTLFLDEIGDMSPSVQAHLLRVLQEGQLRRVGGEKSVRVDVRLVTATHRDLRRQIRDGKFREDLYYRLRGAELEVPSLRARIEDIPLLVDHFLRSIPPARRLEIGPPVLRALSRHGWPGNVRELRAEVTRWKVFCGERVELTDLSPEILGRDSELPVSNPHERTTKIPCLADVVATAEAAAVHRALEACGGNISSAARALGIDRHTLKRKMAAMTVGATRGDRNNDEGR